MQKYTYLQKIESQKCISQNKSAKQVQDRNKYQCYRKVNAHS